MVDKFVHYLMCKVGVYYFTRKALCQTSYRHVFEYPQQKRYYEG